MPPTKRVFGLIKQEWALIAITAVWGGTFIVIHFALHSTGPLFFVAARFLTAGIISSVIFHRSLLGMTWKEFGAGAAIGVTIFLSYAPQTIGLQTITPSTSAFISALYVPLVPLLQWIVFRKLPRRATLVGVSLAFIGLLLVAAPGLTTLGLGVGEILTILSAIAAAGEIILLGYLAPKINLARLTVIQLLVAGLLAFGAMPLVGESIPAFSWTWAGAALALAAASTLIQLTMGWAQRSISPTRATIIYAGEPVWGGFYGALAGDRLPAIAFVGAALIVSGTLVSEVRPRSRRRKRRLRRSVRRRKPHAQPAKGRLDD